MLPVWVVVLRGIGNEWTEARGITRAVSKSGEQLIPYSLWNKEKIEGRRERREKERKKGGNVEVGAGDAATENLRARP